jgi:hypothetical protein
MYRYPERRLWVEEFDCQLPREARAELGARPRRESAPSPPSVHQVTSRPEMAISPPSPPEAKRTATPWFVGVLSAIALIGVVSTALNHSGGAGSQVWAECTASRAMTIVASRPATTQSAQQPVQVEVRRALPVDTVEVRRAELVVPRAELVRLPGE